jgi:MurNAc alpha-1-phosphate uridylyltransferase
MRPDTAVILSAGLGTRMRPLTLTTPKPLLHLGGRPILAHVLDRLRAAGVKNIIVNAHHLGDQIAAFLENHPKIILRREPDLLDTGGAIAAMRAENLLPATPFYIINGDTYWVDGPQDIFTRMAHAYSPESTEILLLLARAAGAVAETGRGDFLWPRGEPLRRRGERDVAPYLYAGIQLVSPKIFDGAPASPFSMNLLWDQALAQNRLGAIVHDGVWFHLSTPEDLARAEAVLAARTVGNTT